MVSSATCTRLLVAPCRNSLPTLRMMPSRACRTAAASTLGAVAGSPATMITRPDGSIAFTAGRSSARTRSSWPTSAAAEASSTIAPIRPG